MSQEFRHSQKKKCMKKIVLNPEKLKEVLTYIINGFGVPDSEKWCFSLLDKAIHEEVEPEQFSDKRYNDLWNPEKPKDTWKPDDRGNKVVIRSYCQAGCDCPTCHQGIDRGTDPKNCFYCQLKWYGYGEYGDKQPILSSEAFRTAYLAFVKEFKSK